MRVYASPAGRDGAIGVDRGRLELDRPRHPCPAHHEAAHRAGDRARNGGVACAEQQAQVDSSKMPRPRTPTLDPAATAAR